ncbi:hypothetical protein E4198_20950 [Streptomyces sp. RKND-216]|uniref:hypothetical protein n=1 Tax=Streptomyces sp. RKND-216 TaxID=2562581 RepID=UPI00109DCA1F|nr:hypothetical protein [Streptomyces sp. RKND-216]THA26802.1 hypothetical protein E4198_20950 [Streptomyces sp. RKND-216]
MSTHGADAPTAGHRSAEPESLAQLRGDCARMSERWPRTAHGAAPGAAASERPRGVHVPERSAHLLDGMSEYGD